MKILESKTEKWLVSPEVNYYFNKETGYMATWGKTQEEDPDFSPYGNFIADIEISTACNGVQGKLCKYCYKQATKTGKNMSLETYKKLFAKLPKTLTQVAFGTDSQAKANPEFFDIMQYTRDNGVIPNVTVADIDDEIADKLAAVCGAVAVSNHSDVCYDSVYKLTSRGMNQINIHQILATETLPRILDLLFKVETDYRLANLNAIVFLNLKQKGRGVGFTPVSVKQREDLLDYLFENNIRFGSDSCGGMSISAYLSKKGLLEKYGNLIDPCESGLYSIYCDVNGNFYPCSFVTEPYFQGINLLDDNVDFLKDVWFNPTMVQWRENLLKCGRSCPVYKV